MNKYTAAFIAGILTLLTFTIASAGILVSPSIINFLSDGLPRKDIVIMNQGEENAYIDIRPYIVENPGTELEKKVVIHDPEKLGLLVSPKKLIIPPGQHRMLRIMMTAPFDDSERIYRIEVVPVPKELLPGQKKAEGKKIGVRVVVAYEVLAIVRPENMQPDFTVTRKGKQLLIKNKGNTNVILVKGEQCVNDECFTLKPRRIYAGNVWETTLKFDAPITITTDYMGTRNHVTSD